jgi:hypothetical protein
MIMSKEEKKRVRVFVPQTFEGVTSVAILEELIKDTENVELDIRYVSYLDFRDYQLFKDVEVVITLGLPYKGYALPDDFHLEVDNPFTDFIHAATYGERIEGDHILSFVNPDADPIKEIANFLYLHPDSSILTKHLEFTDKAWYLIEAVNSYRTWTWENNNTTRMLLALYYASYKWLPKLIRGLELPDMVKQYAPIIKGQLEKMNDYIARKRDMTKSYHVDIDGQVCLVKVVFSDEYINELANDLLNSEQTSTPVVVCVGRTTKSSDMFSIRTRVVNAGRIAYLINEGSGKETVASVFTGVGYAELMGNGIIAKLSQSAPQ